MGCVEKLDGDAGTGDLGTRGRQEVGLEDFETQGIGDVGTRGRGEAFLPFVQLFIIFHKILFFCRNCVVPQFYVPRLYNVKQRYSKYI